MNTIETAKTNSRGKLPMRGKSNKRIRKRAKTACKGWKKVTGALQENILTLLCFDAEACPLIIAAVDTALFESQIYRNIADRAIAYFRKYKTAAGDHLPDLLEEFLQSPKRAEVRLYTDAINDLFRTHDGINREYILGELQAFVRDQSLRQSITLAAEELQAGNVDIAESVLAKALGQEREARPRGPHGPMRCRHKAAELVALVGRGAVPAQSVLRRW